MWFSVEELVLWCLMGESVVGVGDILLFWSFGLKTVGVMIVILEFEGVFGVTARSAIAVPCRG